MTARLQRVALDAVDAAPLPAIRILRADQACVLLGWDGDTARGLRPEPAPGDVTLPRAERAQRHSGVVLFVRPRFRFDARTPDVRRSRAGHWFWSALLAQRFVYRDVLWAALLVNLSPSDTAR